MPSTSFLFFWSMGRPDPSCHLPFLCSNPRAGCPVSQCRASLGKFCGQTQHSFVRIASRESTHPAKGGAYPTTGTNSSRHQREKLQDARAACTVQFPLAALAPRKRRCSRMPGWRGAGHEVPARPGAPGSPAECNAEGDAQNGSQSTL